MIRFRWAMLAGALLFISTLQLFAAADDANNAIEPIAEPASSPSAGNSVQWSSLFRQAFLFLSVEHGFRVATDPDTRDNLGGPFFRNYLRSTGNLHGWSDGDPLFVNYVGHPMQGAISGDIWVHNDLRYRQADFGKNRAYWVGRMRAMVFAWAYSEQFEIGPISEATIGAVQSRFPQQGFVDQVITPLAGVGWMVAEDAVDRYIIRAIEARSGNRFVRIAARGFLNPSRAFANLMEMEKPWHRETRPDQGVHRIEASVPREAPKNNRAPVDAPARLTPSFEFALISSDMLLGVGRNNVPCVGGGGSGTFNVSRAWGIEGDVSGCKMLALANNVSGDATTFMIGPRYTYRGMSHWAPWAHALFGGEKITQETLDPAAKEAVDAAAPPNTSAWLLHDKYTQHYESTGLAAEFGAGVDWVLNPAVAFRVGDFNYTHSWTNDSRIHSSDARLTMGVVLRIGSGPENDGI